jgi:hypothetical protein
VETHQLWECVREGGGLLGARGGEEVVGTLEVAVEDVWSGSGAAVVPALGTCSDEVGEDEVGALGGPGPQDTKEA